jgi:seryl-tRNA synthetase
MLMLDLHYVREHLEDVEGALRKRGMDRSLDDFRRIDRSRRDLLVQVEELKKTRNASSKKIGEVIRTGGDAESLKQEVRKIGGRISELDAELETAQRELRELMVELPNLPHPTVPEGKTEADNPVERTWGNPPEFDFEPADHADLGPALGILDFERAAKMTGARFALYLGDGARLERALIQFMLDLQTKEHGYTEVLPPFMVNAGALFGTGQLPKFEEDLFKVDPEGYYLIPTAEVPVTNIHADEILDPDRLPIAYCAYTPCFRSEAGSYGKDVRGLIRQHQFNKVELVRFTKPDQSWDQLELLTSHAEEVLKRLALHYRVVTLCTGDLGFAASKTYDLEVWMPAQGTYREISSCSNFTDFQARRAKIRFKPEGKKKTEPVHTLNGSGLAVGRTLVAILENGQQKDGSVVIPEALRSYMDGQERIIGGQT